MDNSDFFVGANTMKSLKSLQIKSKNGEVELGGLLFTKSGNKELQVHECTSCPATGKAFNPEGLLRQSEKRNLPLGAIFRGFWHTHFDNGGNAYDQPSRADFNGPGTTFHPDYYYFDKIFSGLNGAFSIVSARNGLMLHRTNTVYRQNGKFLTRSAGERKYDIFTFQWFMQTGGNVQRISLDQNKPIDRVTDFGF